LQSLAMNEGVRRKGKLWSAQGRVELQKLSLAPWASRRRQELLELLDRIDPGIEELTMPAEREARKRPEVARLMTHPGVGPLTALAFVLIIGTPERFQRGKQIGTYVGLIPSEDSSAGKQRLGHISKHGNSLLRFLLVEAAQAAARYNVHWRRRYVRLAMHRHRSIAKVALGRRLEFGCTGCGETAVIIRRRWSSVRTRDSSVPDMVCSRTPSTLMGIPLPAKGV
jgi:transposase